jgi:hypothetical protein
MTANNPSKRKGQSLIEFAASLLVLIILVAGIIDVGRVIFTYIQMRDAAQEGASFGSVFPTYCVQMEDRALNNLQDPSGFVVHINIDNTDCYEATDAQACLGHLVTVTITQPNFAIGMPLIGAFIGQTLSLSASSNDTIIRTPCR